MKSLILTIMVCIFGVAQANAQGQNYAPLYTLSNGNIYPNSSWIDPFYLGDISNTTPYTLKRTVTVATSSSQYGTYKINFYKFKNWEDEPGRYNVIEITRNGTPVLELKNSLGWDYFPAHLEIHDDYYVRSIGYDTYVLMFNEKIYASQPSFTTLVLIHKNSVKLVFNKKMFINSFDPMRRFGIRLQANTTEWIDRSTPANAPDPYYIYSSSEDMFITRDF